MTATSSIRTAQSQQNEPSLASSTAQGSMGPRSFQSPQSIRDSEADPPPEEPVDGWPTVAKMMATTPEFGNLCRFSDLNMKSLLYYQAELFQLRKKLHKLEYKDKRTAEQGSRPSNFYWRADFLVASQDDVFHEQWDVIVKIRKVLKEYNKALLQWTQLSNLPSPDPYNVESFRQWLAAQTVDDPDDPRQYENNVGGDGEEHIWGNIYQPESKPTPILRRFLLLLWHLVAPKNERKRRRQRHLDLVATGPSKEPDFLTRWVMEEFIPFYNDLKQKSLFLEWLSIFFRNIKQHINCPTIAKIKTENDTEKDAQQPQDTKNNESTIFEAVTIETYSGKNMLRFTSAVATIIACLLPTVAITVLSKIDDTGSRLGAIAGFTALFAAGLMGLTDAGTSRVEIFTATAAFSAVMVVFVQNSTPVQGVGSA